MSICYSTHVSNKVGVASIDTCLDNATDASSNKMDNRNKDAFKKGTFLKGKEQAEVLEFYRSRAEQVYEQVGGTKQVLELTDDDDDDDEDDDDDDVSIH